MLKTFDNRVALFACCFVIIVGVGSLCGRRNSTTIDKTQNEADINHELFANKFCHEAADIAQGLVRTIVTRETRVRFSVSAINTSWIEFELPHFDCCL